MSFQGTLERSLTESYETITLLLSDLSDADLLVRPVPRANHSAWLLGHLILREARLVGSQDLRVKYPKLPVAFEKPHGSTTVRARRPSGFLSKAKYLGLFAKVNRATMAAVASLSDGELEKPVRVNVGSWARTLGELFLQIGDERGTCLGQLAIIRRRLGKPVLL